jgi:hypothetical protein
MPAYLLTGPNGAGKSTVGRELANRGYNVIETDHESGISGWFDNKTGKKLDFLPPHPLAPKWLTEHSWLWDRQRIEEIIAEQAGKIVFFVGGAYNQGDMYDLFDKHFTFYVDDETATRRLQARGEGNRWQSDSAELQKMLDWNHKSKQHALEAGSIPIDSSRAVTIIADEIIAYVGSNC